MLSHRSKFLLILLPSLFSFTANILLAIATMATLSLTYLTGKGTVYDYLFGPGSSADSIASSRSTLSALNNTVLGNAILNKVLYFAFWMVVGLAVYIILYAVLRGTGEAAAELKESNYANIRREKILQDFAIKFSVRVAAVCAWITFVIIFLKVLLPFSSLAARTAASKFISSNGILYSFLGFVVVLLSLHILVVLTRFIFLRVRLFSQQEIGV